MKVYIYSQSGGDFYISTRKPTKNEWNMISASYDPWKIERPESQLPIHICTRAARKLIKESSKKLPARNSNEILELDLRVK